MSEPLSDDSIEDASGAPVLISVCVLCRAEGADESPRPGAVFFEAARAAIGTGVVVRPVQCLGVCKRPTSVAVTGADGYSFVFGGLEGAAGVAALAAFARSYASHAHGFVPWRERAEELRRGLVARIPPAAWSPADGRTPA